MKAPNGLNRSISFAIVGSGGAGALTAGAILLETAGKAGWYGIMNRSVGPQIRGGEAAALVRLSTHPVDCMAECFDFLIAIDWRNADRFAAEMPLVANGLAIGDPAGGDVPSAIADSGATVAQTAMKELAGSVPGGRENMIAAGLAAALAGLPIDALMSVVASKLASKGDEAIEASRACISLGSQQAESFEQSFHLERPAASSAGRWLITGNEAVGLGAVRGGIRFAAAYPITPATEVLEWLAPALTKVGGALVQAEDELASINMAIGASFGGRASITATSGPGLALMVEALGLATASEIPIVVVDVMRGGPSTGIPTKSEQSDLNIAVYGCHGDAPHIVVAPLSVADCLFTAQWAVHLAEAMQAPAIVLSDQSLGQARALIDRPADIAFIARRNVLEAEPEQTYDRYALTGSGVSPMAIPGIAGGQYTADGLTHTTKGIPSSKESDHQNQLDKRRNKIDDFDYGNHWADIETSNDTGAGTQFTILTWGSLAGPAREAMRILADEGITVKLLAMRLISPFLKQEFLAALEGTQRILIVEQTHSGQFHEYLRAKCDLLGQVRHFHRPGPKLIGPAEICAQIRDWKTA
ncbi:MAG: 2-oxoacid:acceptor oxidoreductase subunit alpha [Hyphomicrobiales bacterium]|nr:2-oxoacid:acceptor oxidoreductase subunit alpha [Hyphomicrobiales bacterium]